MVAQLTKSAWSVCYQRLSQNDRFCCTTWSIRSIFDDATGSVVFKINSREWPNRHDNCLLFFERCEILLASENNRSTFNVSIHRVGWRDRGSYGSHRTLQKIWSERNLDRCQMECFLIDDWNIKIVSRIKKVHLCVIGWILQQKCSKFLNAI